MKLLRAVLGHDTIFEDTDSDPAIDIESSFNIVLI